MNHTFTNNYGEHFVVIRLDVNSPVTSLDQQTHYDVFIVNKVASIPAENLEALASTLVLFKLGWIEIFGLRKALHDVIDRAAVLAARQTGSDDGYLMTTWDEDLTADDEFASYALTGGQGTNESKVILVIGDEDAELRVCAEFIVRAALKASSARFLTEPIKDLMHEFGRRWGEQKLTAPIPDIHSTMT